MELPADTGNIITNKLGPLPVWAWGIVILGGAYGAKLYKDHKSGGATAKTTASTSAGYNSSSLPSNVQPFYTTIDEDNQSYVNSPISLIGRQQVDAGATGVSQNVSANTSTNTTTIAPAPIPPTPVTAPVVAPPAPAGQYVTITKWKPHQKKGTPSTIAGLAYNAYGNENAWHKIWTAPQNASLVARRGKPSNIQTGDKFFVPQ